MRFPRHWIFALGLAAAVSALAADAATPASPVTLRLKRGDDPRWAAPDWDDHGWLEVSPGLVIPVHDGIYWVRFRLRQSQESSERDVNRMLFWPRDEPGSPINALIMAGPFSFDLHWDGRLIRRSGVVGAERATETPGPLDNLVAIPEDLLGPGEHVVALRVSTAHYNFTTERAGFYFAMVNFTDRLVYETRQPILPLVGAGGAVLGVAFCSSLFWFVDRRRPLLLGSALSLVIGLFYFLIAWRWLHEDPYDWFAPRLAAITVTATLISGLQAWLLLEQFALPRKRFWLAAFAPLIMAAWLSSPFHSVIVLWLYRATLGFSVVAAGWAVARRCIGARGVLVAALLGLVSLPLVSDTRSFVNPAFLLTFGAQLLCLLIALGLQLRGDRRQARDVALTAARLETELLKKNLQPHFLLNTLTAVSEVIEQDPAGAVKFIDDLAAEFRSLALMSGERLVPLKRELDLCRAHLKVISRRTGRQHDLLVEGVSEDALVPPALFLTLIENGLIHQQAADGAAFRLVARATEGGVNFAFVSPGRTRELTGRPAGGTGLRYVKARMEESFPGRWTFSQQQTAAGWETVIGWQAESGTGGAT